MNTSENINELATALAAAQGDLTDIPKNHVNPHFKNKYADLTDGLSVIRPVLSKHGIALIQATEFEGDVMILNTRLLHKSGQWIGAVYPVCKIGPQQAMGSALTYAKRYSLFSLVGVSGDDDTDGEGAADAAPPAKRERFVQAAKAVFPGAKVVEPAPNSDAAEYVRQSIAAVKDWQGDVNSLRDWWKQEGQYRERAGVTNGTPEYDELYAAFVAMGKSLSASRAA